MPPMTRILPSSLAFILLAGCALLTPLPRDSTLAERLAMFPTAQLPLQQPVRIYWDKYQIPFIEAATDGDAAFALGLVHAHLRLGQMEVLRRIAQGRLAEMGGPLATDIDHSLRILDYGKAAPAIVASMPPDTRRWLERFVAGINHYQANTADLPHEFALLGLEREPWRPEDVVTLGRLASTDVTWLVWFRLLQQRDTPEWSRLWPRVAAAGANSAPSFERPAQSSLRDLEDLWSRTARSGSNSVALAPSRTATGGALMANDPHLGFSLPNLWLIAGLKSPSYHAVGFMVPGLPFVAVGRNERIAWGGTNLRSASSDLFDVSALPPEQVATRTETIGVRWWFDSAVTIRDTPYGPLISDAPSVPAREGERIALSWIGHRASDEMTAMLAVNRARNWTEFGQALRGFALSAQNFLYADVDGNIGQITAAHLPRRPAAVSGSVVRPLADAGYWQDIATAADLPAAFNPANGFLASANNKPAASEILIGYFFSADDRVLRLNERLSARRDWTVDGLRQLQLDTYRRSAVALRDALLQRVTPDRASPEVEQARALELIAQWDGNYGADSRGALAFEALMSDLIGRFYDEPTRELLGAGGSLYDFLLEDLAAMDAAAVDGAVRSALPVAAAALAEHGTWGELHRLPVQHLLGNVPVIGGSYRFDDLPAAGGNETILKTAHDLTAERHFSRYGAQARHISDMADPDANWFVLLGGQDGWFNSSTFRDQVEPFQSGRLVRVPLRLDTVRTASSHLMTLTP